MRKLTKAILGLSLALMAGCASVDCDPMYEVAGTAFYATTNTTSAAFWESVLNDALSKRAFVLYSTHTKKEYLGLVALEGRHIHCKIHQPRKGVFWVHDFPAQGNFCRFAVHDYSARGGAFAVETGDSSPSPDEVCGERGAFEVDVEISKNLVAHYMRHSFNPVEAYPFLSDVLKKIFKEHADYCLVGPMIKTDSDVFVYVDGSFFEIGVPLVTDKDNVAEILEYPHMFMRAVECPPLDGFWKSENLKNDDARFFHAYLLKLYEQVIVNGTCVRLND